jgi:Zn-finger nucleic acid-binding protein
VRRAATQRYCTVQCQVPLEPKIIRGIEIDRCLKCDGYWFDGGEVQRLLNSYGQGRASRFRQRVNDDFQHPLKKPAAKSTSSSNLGRAMVDVSLDTGAETVLQIVLESLSSIDW